MPQTRLLYRRGSSFLLFHALHQLPLQVRCRLNLWHCFSHVVDNGLIDVHFGPTVGAVLQMAGYKLGLLIFEAAQCISRYPIRYMSILGHTSHLEHIRYVRYGPADRLDLWDPIDFA